MFKGEPFVEFKFSIVELDYCKRVELKETLTLERKKRRPILNLFLFRNFCSVLTTKSMKSMKLIIMR